ncbi:MAG: hypothetical protein CSA24_03310 [Deltaproteobacteria bacterium]|nr:MAG: hypothetical protein CSB49_09040 [Pseudomonadota bacterium]PIE64003.1 MAG: hypothetical protein CSA24_03310 [Deltaproteobacteria bacterium]
MNRRRGLKTEKEVVELAIAYVFREHAAKELADAHDVSDKTILRRLRAFGVRIRSSSEQRRCDQRRGRYDHSGAVRAAWARGAFNTERYRDSRPSGNWGFERHGSANPFFGRQHRPESRRLMSDAAKARSIPGIGSYGDDWTPELRGRVMLRDDHRCQVCGAWNAVLQVHHVDHDRRNNAETNLLTVCAPCHLAYHGRGELQEEMRAVHFALVARLRAPREAPP